MSKPWTENAELLAEQMFTMAVNRTDAYGACYCRNGKIMPTGWHDTLTLGRLPRRFPAAHAADLVVLHTTSVRNTSRWFSIEIDAHGGDSRTETVSRRRRGGSGLIDDPIQIVFVSGPKVSSNGAIKRGIGEETHQ